RQEHHVLLPPRNLDPAERDPFAGAVFREQDAVAGRYSLSPLGRPNLFPLNLNGLRKKPLPVFCRRLKPARIIRDKGLIATTEVVPCYKASVARVFRSL